MFRYINSSVSPFHLVKAISSAKLHIFKSFLIIFIQVLLISLFIFSGCLDIVTSAYYSLFSPLYTWPNHLKQISIILSLLVLLQVQDYL